MLTKSRMTQQDLLATVEQYHPRISCCLCMLISLTGNCQETKQICIHTLTMTKRKVQELCK